MSDNRRSCVQVVQDQGFPAPNNPNLEKILIDVEGSWCFQVKCCSSLLIWPSGLPLPLVSPPHALLARLKNTLNGIGYKLWTQPIVSLAYQPMFFPAMRTLLTFLDISEFCKADFIVIEKYHNHVSKFTCIFWSPLSSWQQSVFHATSRPRGPIITTAVDGRWVQVRSRSRTPPLSSVSADLLQLKGPLLGTLPSSPLPLQWKVDNHNSFECQLGSWTSGFTCELS